MLWVLQYACWALPCFYFYCAVAEVYWIPRTPSASLSWIMQGFTMILKYLPSLTALVWLWLPKVPFLPHCSNFCRCSSWISSTVLSGFEPHWGSIFQNQALLEAAPGLLQGEDRWLYFVWYVWGTRCNYKWGCWGLFCTCRLLLVVSFWSCSFLLYSCFM